MIGRPRFAVCLAVRLAAALGAAALAVAGCESPAAPPAPVTPQATGPGASPAVADRPVIGQWHDLVYHERLGATILVNGGPEKATNPEAALELWSWDGSSWRRLSGGGPAGTDAPRWRNFASTAYDSDRGVLVVHGGLQEGGELLSETWEWDGTTWRKFTGDGPGGREGAGMAYDAERKVTLLFGGFGADDVHGDTWAWNGTAWRRLTDAGPSPRAPSLMEFDPVRRNVVLYGGHVVGQSLVMVADTWVWDGRGWRRLDADSPPGPRVNAPGAFHAGLGRMLIVGGGSETATLQDMWGWDGSTWAKVETSGQPTRQAHGVAYDPARQRLVLTGGLDRPGAAERYQDVWEWAGAAWAGPR
jgi:hypothetical protein